MLSVARKRTRGYPLSQHPDRVKHTMMRTRTGAVVVDAKGNPIQTREYVFTRQDGSQIVIQEHSAGHKFGEDGVGDQPPHFNVRPIDRRRTGKVPGTDDHYSW